MSNSNIKSRGFTIVELLIVIVVIAILATISIVAYNGIQSRGKTSASQSLASQIAKKAEAYNTIESSYPSYTQLTSNTGAGTPGNSAEAKLDDTNSVVDAGTGTNIDAADDFVNGTRVGYKACATGGQVVWWDFSENAVKYMGVGGASSTALCS